MEGVERCNARLFFDSIAFRQCGKCERIWRGEAETVFVASRKEMRGEEAVCSALREPLKGLRGDRNRPLGSGIRVAKIQAPIFLICRVSHEG